MRKIIYLFFAMVLIFTCSNAFSQSFIVMKAMDGATKLNGESTVPGHTGEIDLYSYSQGDSHCTTCNVPQVSDSVSFQNSPLPPFPLKNYRLMAQSLHQWMLLS